ncbi:DUF5958 family protein [Streptomyces orinoci]|uniref:DUF5958 family protein n=1 Tax=Streptomyces orinoci TaxID=67339 RepID=A0ABV3JZB4_STRON|nr:DUF5958 family protein [Streptomyces orinoci]
MLNELAQGLRPLSEGLDWFEGLADDEQSLALRELAQFCVQARAVSDDGPEAIRRSGIRPTHTPAVLIMRGGIGHQLGKIAGLEPVHERTKAFRLLVAVLSIADARRRARYCANGCGHQWHRLASGGERGTATASRDGRESMYRLSGE